MFTPMHQQLQPILSACYTPHCVLTAGCGQRADQIDEAVTGQACRVADLRARVRVCVCVCARMRENLLIED